jgi:hypothetical protein
MKEQIDKFSGVALGVLFGVLVGIALENIGLWICVGLAIGAAFDQQRNREQTPKEEDEK